MHISLDSALGQQRRLNQVGESITQIAPDPTAAYSLRSLTGSDPKVVRVRRESDNDEQDFTASEVSSGALVDFVNTQVTAPLDIQALTSTGRDGDFLIAKAAYSLRSLGTRQATVTSSGDTAGDTSGKYVCQVRRNVNGDVKSFTADEVSDGTLTSFVNESFTSSLPLDVAGSAAAAYGLRNLSSSYSGNVVEVRRSSDDTTQNFTADEVTNGTLLAFVGTGGSDNGFVKTWYDQSGNSNNATQTTAANQPKIVSSGVLETDGIDFDGSNDEFDIPTDLISNVNSVSAFLVSKSDVTSSGTPLALSDNSPNDARWYLGNISSNNFNLGYQDSNDKIAIASSDTLQHLFSATSGTVTTEAFIDGTSGGTTSSISSFSPLASGGIGSVNGFGPFNGHIREVIVYDTDQTDKRRAIEESIATANGITLASFNRDGFVRTWYDQSVSDQAGNTPTGNHATQTTADNQPKIVSAGALETDSSGNPALVGDGTDDNLINSTLTNQLDSSDFLITAAYKDELRMGTTGAVPRLYLTSSSMSYNTLNTISYSTQTGRKILSFQVVGDTQEVFANGSSLGTASEAQVDIGQSQFGVMQGGSEVSSGPLMEVLVYNSNQSANRTAIEANIGEHYSISGIPAFDNSVNGFVETWYDQSGNGNDATQGTISLQPKIVDNGVIETDRDGKVALNGLSAELNLPAGAAMLSSDGTFSLFAVVDLGDQRTGSVTFNDLFIFDASSTGGASSTRKPQIYIKQADGSLVSSTPSFNAGTAFIGVSNVTSMQLLTNISNPALSTGNNLIYADGALQGSSNSSTDVNTTTTLKSSGVLIFDSAESSVTHFLSEVIYYPSDQSANRPAIEANIANQYGITLS